VPRRCGRALSMPVVELAFTLRTAVLPFSRLPGGCCYCSNRDGMGRTLLQAAIVPLRTVSTETAEVSLGSSECTSIRIKAGE